ncbi:hypothetical protein FACS189493_3020 [Spirochaetia bacterium]|nr:hypothetical protein FACS189493_3020 [Spirochaetia bacterium]
MKKFIVMGLAGIIALLYIGASTWEGSAAVSISGELPDDGYYVATRSFPRNTVVDVTNLETEKTIRAIVASGLDSTGLLAILSRDVAAAIGIQVRSIGRIRMSIPTDPIALSRFTDGLNSSGDPDYDPQAAITAAAAEPNKDRPQPPVSPGVTPSASTPVPAATQASGSTPTQTPVPAAAPQTAAQTQVPARSPAQAPNPAPGQTSVQTPTSSQTQAQTPAPAQPAQAPTKSPVPAATSAPVPNPAALTAAPAPTTAPVNNAIVDLPTTGAPARQESATPPPANPAGGYDIALIPAEQRPPAAARPSLPPEAEIAPIAPRAPVAGPVDRTAPLDVTIPEDQIIPSRGTAPAPAAPGSAAMVTARPEPPAPSGITFSVPTITTLERGKYYVQIAAYSQAASVESALSRIGRSYPLLVQNGGSPDRPLYRILLGPVSFGEGNALVQRFKGNGYPDVFIRRD